MTPSCYNRPPQPDGRWFRAGYRPTDLKPRLRWHRRQMSDRCAAFDTGDRATPVPVLEGWQCAGCRWNPNERSA